MTKRKDITKDDVGNAIMSGFDHLLDVLSKQEITVMQSGESRAITLAEAVLQTQAKTALAGSTHAQNHLLKNLQRIEEKKRHKLDEQIVSWRRIKTFKQREFEAYRQEHGCDADGKIFPHPDDIYIDEETGVSIRGPINEEEYRALQKTIALRDAFIWQSALDGRQNEEQRPPQMGDAATMAFLMDMSLPMRFQWSKYKSTSLMMQLEGRPIRQLLKETRSAWRKAGVTVPRGWRMPPPKKVMERFNAIGKATKLIRTNPNTTPEDIAKIIWPDVMRRDARITDGADQNF